MKNKQDKQDKQAIAIDRYHDSRLREKDFNALKNAKAREQNAKRITYEKIDNRTTKITYEY